MAGLIDGEGHIGIMKRRPSGSFLNIHYTLRISIGMYSNETISWIHANFGGNRYLKKPYKTTNGIRRLPCHEISWNGQKALTLLKLLLPFLITKKLHAIASIKYQEACPRKGGKALTKKELSRRETIYLKLRTLNKKQS